MEAKRHSRLKYPPTDSKIPSNTLHLIHIRNQGKFSMQSSSPEMVGLSSQRLAQIAPAMQTFVDAGQLAGLATLVYRHGKIVHHQQVGYRDILKQKPITEDTLYRLYTMTKPITTVAMMMLYEQGKFQLADPVSKYIPAFDKTKVYDSMTPTGMKLVDQNPVMTIHHLLTHTSGLSLGLFHDHPAEAVWRQYDLLNRQQSYEHQMETLASLPLLFQPGSNWRYSMSTDVCGYLVEVISGMPFADFLQENLFKPIGMNNTSFMVSEDKLDDLSELYSHNENGKLEALQAGTFRIRDYTVPTPSPSGGAGLVSSLPDYTTFCAMLLNKGEYQGIRILGRKTVEYMFQNHLPYPILPFSIANTVFHGYGFGLMCPIIIDISQTGHIGSDGEYSWTTAGDTYFWIDPQENLFGLFMNQYLARQHPRPPAREQFRNLVYQAIID